VTWDPAHDQRAEANRTAKAVTLARWCWDRAIAPESIEAWDDRMRRQVARTCGVTPPHDDTTWALVRQGLTRWAGEHPAPRVHPLEHRRWCWGCRRADLHQR
jgi:hypothetical protein